MADNNAIKLLQKTVKMLKDTGIHGKQWLIVGVPTIISTAAAIKAEKEAKEAAIRKKKLEYDLLKKPFDTSIKALETVDKELRIEFLSEYSGTEAVYPEEGDGRIEIISKLEAEVQLPGLVPVEYWSVDMGKINAALEAGIVNIPGVFVKKVRSLRVFTGNSKAE